MTPIFTSSDPFCDLTNAILWLQQLMKRFSFALKAHTLVLQVKASSDLKP